MCVTWCRMFWKTLSRPQQEDEGKWTGLPVLVASKLLFLSATTSFLFFLYYANESLVKTDWLTYVIAVKWKSSLLLCLRRWRMYGMALLWRYSCATIYRRYLYTARTTRSQRNFQPWRQEHVFLFLFRKMQWWHICTLALLYAVFRVGHRKTNITSPLDYIVFDSYPWDNTKWTNIINNAASSMLWAANNNTYLTQ